MGFNTGINFSTIVNSNPSDQFNNGRGFLPGLAFGLNTEYLIRDGYSLLFEINYSTKGFTINQTGVRVKSFYNYFEIPFRLKYYSSSQFAIEVGPYIGIAFKEYLKNNITKSKVYGNIGNDYDDELKPLDIGAQGGISYNKNDFSIGLYISYGILNIRPAGGFGSSIRNLSTQVRFNYIFSKLESNEKSF
ncbi:MAG: porin family protein [Cytophagales bacterium]